MSPIIIIAIVFVAVVTLVAAVGAMLASNSATQAEDRLDLLTGASGSTNPKGKEGTSLLSTTADDSKTIAVEFLNRFGDIHRFLSQANVSITPNQFLIATIGLAAAGGSIIFSAGLPYFFAPLAAAALGALPFGFVFIARKRRIGAFARQLPDALELVAARYAPVIAWQRESISSGPKCPSRSQANSRAATRSRISVFRLKRLWKE